MNERIDELMYHAGLTAQGCWDHMGDYEQQSIMKFAELIVRECVKSVNCYEALNILDRFGIDSEHFGVEE